MYHLNYGVIGNCKTAALVSDKGSIDWLCFPYFDSPSVFSKILDKDKGGSFSIIVDEDYTISQHYVRNTNILRTVFTSTDASFELLDFMPRYKTSEQTYYLPSEVYRYIRPLNGKPCFKVHYQPKLNYAREEVYHKQYSEFIKSYSVSQKGDNLFLYTSLDFSAILEEKEIKLEQEEFMLLSYHQKLLKIDIEKVYLEYQRTKVYWLNWHNRSRKFETYNEIISRSLLTLKMMSFQETGAVLAAITTSIPETIGETRNWDYRFCWIRDASMSMETLFKMGHHSAAKRFMDFIMQILKSKSDTFQIMYALNGERILNEEIFFHLSGFENSPPLRIGNAAYLQKQNDSLGYLMDVLFSYYTHFPGTLDELETLWEIVKKIANTVTAEWKEKDQSIWEFRNIEKHFVFSKVMCWVALDRAVKVAALLNRKYHEELWNKEAESIRADVLKNGWNEKIGSFTQSYESNEVDASLLLMEAYGFLKPEDPLYVKTVKKVKEELFHDGLMYRYKNKDDFGYPSSAFTTCTFWLIRALFVTGEKKEAEKIFHNLIEYSNHLGLFSEDLDFKTKRQLGNFPQAYSHLALINTALLFTKEKVISTFVKP